MFNFRASQFATLRKRQISAKILRHLEDSGQRAEVDPSTGEIVAQDVRGYSRRLGFDDQGFLGRIVSPLGRQWILANTPDGKISSLTTPAKSLLSFDFTPEGRLSCLRQNGISRLQFTYDSEGNPSRITHPDQTTTCFEWLRAGQPLQITNRLNHSTRFEYDTATRLRTFTDAEGRQTSFKYDHIGRPCAIEYPNGTRDEIFHQRGGTELRMGDEFIATLRRDPAGRVLEARYRDGETLAFSYDEAGRILSASRNGETISCKYNKRGQPIAERSGDQEIKYEYDAAGLLVAMRLPSKESIEYGYDADMRLSWIQDWTRRRYTWEYFPGDQVSRIHSPNGLTTSLKKTPEGWMQKLEVGPLNGQPTLQCSYERNVEGLLLRATESLRSSTVTRSTAYTYDAEGQLLSAKTTNEASTEYFAYDRVGNRVRVNDAIAEYDAANQLRRQGNIRCDYDSRGNLTSLIDGHGTWNFEYNARNLLVRVQRPTGGDVTFGYDAFGRRTWKQCGERKVRYLWAGEHLIREEWQEVGELHARDYLYIPGTHTALGLRFDNRTFTVHTDHLGAPLQVTNELGRSVWTATYSAFGRASQEGMFKQPLRLPGQYEDEETGLYYNRFRYYHPDLGRFITRDPLSFQGGLNLYRYANNNPINEVDPLGLWSWKGVVSALAGVAAAVAVVALAPAAVPLLAVGMAAIGLGAAVGFTVNRILDGGAFCWPCFLKGVLDGIEALPAFLLLAMLAPEVAIAVGVLGLVMLACTWSDMTDAQKDEALGGLWFGAIVGLAGMLMSPSMARPPPEYELPVRPLTDEVPVPVPAEEVPVPPAVEEPPPTPGTHKNAHLAGKQHPKTGVPFNEKGFPEFESQFDATIPEELRGPEVSDRQQFKNATEQLSEYLKENPSEARKFTETQLKQIEQGQPKIKDLTWHHHEDGTTLQLVDESVHAKTGHAGGRATTGGRPK